MACPIQCTCGRNLAEMFPAFDALYRAHTREQLKKSKIHPLKQGIVSGEVEPIVYIFQFLNIRSICCRNKIKNFRDSERINFEYAADTYQESH